MANTQANSKDKKMAYKPVKFDVNEIAPDAPAGEWKMSIPRGKIRVRPTAKDNYPMLLVPIRLDGTDSDEEIHEKALGAELTVMIVFFGEDADPRAVRLAKLRLRQLCEATDVDLDIIPKDLNDPENDLEPLIRALEGKKFTGWTKVTQRKDTGEEVAEVQFTDPSRPIATKKDPDDDDDSNDDDDDKPAPRASSKKPAKKPAAKRR